jgi:hypothetical protein
MAWRMHDEGDHWRVEYMNRKLVAVDKPECAAKYKHT